MVLEKPWGYWSGFSAEDGVYRLQWASLIHVLGWYPAFMDEQKYVASSRKLLDKSVWGLFPKNPGGELPPLGVGRWKWSDIWIHVFQLPSWCILWWKRVVAYGGEWAMQVRVIFPPTHLHVEGTRRPTSIAQRNMLHNRGYWCYIHVPRHHFLPLRHCNEHFTSSNFVKSRNQDTSLLRTPHNQDTSLIRTPH